MASARVLDVGSGDGEWVRRMLRASPKSVTCVDIVRTGAASLPVKFHIANLSSDRLPLADASVDLVTAIEVVEHLANPRHFVSEEAARVLAPGERYF